MGDIAPGPWKYCEEEDSRNCLQDAEGRTVATFDELFCSPEHREATKALLLEAPAMFKVLLTLRTCPDARGATLDCITGSCVHERARQIIARVGK